MIYNHVSPSATIRVHRRQHRFGLPSDARDDRHPLLDQDPFGHRQLVRRRPGSARRRRHAQGRPPAGAGRARTPAAPRPPAPDRSRRPPVRSSSRPCLPSTIARQRSIPGRSHRRPRPAATGTAGRGRHAVAGAVTLSTALALELEPVRTLLEETSTTVLATRWPTARRAPRRCISPPTLSCA